MGAYGLTTSIGTGSASDAWSYSFTEPDPLTAVVELNHDGTVSTSVPLIYDMTFSLLNSHSV